MCICCSLPKSERWAMMFLHLSVCVYQEDLDGFSYNALIAIIGCTAASHELLESTQVKMADTANQP